MGRVIVLGSLITDLVARAPRLPRPGETVLGDDLATFLGGKGCNQAAAAARLGAHVSLIGQVGADDYGDAFFPALAAEGIDAHHVSRDPAVGTGIACILVGEATGQNMIVVTPRANLTLTPEMVAEAMGALVAAHRPPELEAARPVFLTQCETSLATVRTGLERAHRARWLTILNSAPIPREPLDDALLTFVDLLVPNETEAGALAGTVVDTPESAQVAAERLLARGPRSVVITLGAQGYLWSERSDGGAVMHRHEPSFAVDAVDATAAGDAFCGALAAGLADGLPMERALRRANAAGAVAVTGRGALPSLPVAAEVEALLGGE